MKRQQAYKFEWFGTGAQRRLAQRFAGCRRFVFNKGLALQKDMYEASGTKHSYADLCKLLTVWRHSPDTAWLADAPVHPLQQGLKDLDAAYKNFFARRTDFPTFKKKDRGDSFRYPDPKQIKLDQANDRIFLPKLGWIRYRKSREVIGALRNVTVSSAGGKWFISIQTEQEVAAPLHPATGTIGIDLGVAKSVALSDGSVFAGPNSFRQHQHRLAHLQRGLARKTKFSNNWKKAKKNVTRLHTRIAHIRRDFLHKTTTAISKNHALACIEDLKVSNMSRSAKGSLAHPGKNVRAKSGLNRAILDQGMNEFRRQLEYKQGWLGGWVKSVAPQYTSQTCPRCGHVSPDNRKRQGAFLCVRCEFAGNADWVAAINIEAKGLDAFEGLDSVDASTPAAEVVRLARIACGGKVQSGRPMKQEPTEAIMRGAAHA
jgi:putative transposase